MTCESYQHETSRLLDGELTPNASIPVFAHLASCTECAAWFHDQVAFSGFLRTLPPVRQSRIITAPDRAARRGLNLFRAASRLRISTVALWLGITLFVGSLFSASIRSDGGVDVRQHPTLGLPNE